MEKADSHTTDLYIGITKMLTWHKDQYGYWSGRTRTGQDVADIHPRRLHDPFRWVVGGKTGTAPTVQFAQRKAEEAYAQQAINTR